MKKKMKILTIAFLFMAICAMYSKTMAATICQNISEDKVKYVNATFTKINREEYNAEQRGMHWMNIINYQWTKDMN